MEDLKLFEDFFTDEGEDLFNDVDWNAFQKPVRGKNINVTPYPEITANKGSLTINRICTDLLGLEYNPKKESENVVLLNVGFNDKGNRIVIAKKKNDFSMFRFSLLKTGGARTNHYKMLKAILIPDGIVRKFYPKYDKKANALYFSTDDTVNFYRKDKS